MTIEASRLQARLGLKPDGIIGPDTLTQLFYKCGAAPERARELGLSANVHFRTAGILANPLRLAHAMAQLIHESGGFRYMEEIASGQAYEGRKDLGNVRAGDGKLFKGRGPIQLTGRRNYQVYGARLGIDFERHPEVVALPSIGLMVACEYWSSHKLNALADADNLHAITRKINGGLNGLADRAAALTEMKGFLL
ncbi:putative chitinase [Sphingomonas kaistensis]|uniref:Putative chitinase n=1 Tax=Sphingomonas kaistensis TaxID=298708 RepID=A0A7X6BHV0_9SPHN|nr:glycoside hydrolase family 19 protein [Sphingomonas kaistensis]NJC06502.1 putative chitinase [Sphingomonas kaistensis]